VLNISKKHKYLINIPQTGDSMKITIDTQHDTPQDIKKVMQILSHFSGEGLSNISQPATPTDNTGFASMFGDNTPTDSTNSTNSLNSTETSPSDTVTITPATSSEAPMDFNSILNLTRQNQETEEKQDPKVEYF